MKPLDHELERQLAQAWPPKRWRDVTVVVAVSGGADSVALLRALTALRLPGAGRLLVGHLNHQLRGGESDEDESFVRQLADSVQCPCFVGKTEQPLPQVAPDGLEAAAREARFRFLRQLADRHGARYVALGHTADDQAETILHRILRGTGMAGLAGMRPTRRLSELTTLVRPLLGVCREQLRGYLRDTGQSHRNDSSNDDLDFTRNRIRHDLIPQLARQYNPKVGEALIRLGRHADQAQRIVDQLVADLCERHVRTTDSLVRLECPPLAGQPKHLLCEMLIAIWKQRRWPLQAMTSQKWGELAALIRRRDSDSLQVCLPGQIVATRSAATLCLAKQA